MKHNKSSFQGKMQNIDRSSQRGYSINRTVLLGLTTVCGALMASSAAAAEAAVTGAAVATNAPAAKPEAAPAAAKDAAAVTKVTKPAWLSEISLSVKESYDNNVYLNSVSQEYLDSKGLKGESKKEIGSFITSVSPKVAFNLAPALGTDGLLETISVGYAPEFVKYHNQDAESYNAHKISTGIKGKSGDISLNLENGFSYVDGAKEGTVFPGSLSSAYATAASRERKSQFQDRSKFSARFDQDSWFVRPTASLLWYDFGTDQKNPAAATTPSGYQNYADRYDVNGGVDFGYKLNKDVAATLGYRYGHQYQQQYSFYKESSSSDYQRVLLGFEGKPLSWLKVELQGGPDFRSYEDNTATHTSPVTDKHRTTYYGEAAITADLTKSDAIAIKYRAFQWVSSTGRVPYFDSLYDLSYKHKFTSKLTAEVGGRLSTSDYNMGNISNSLRERLDVLRSDRSALHLHKQS